MANQSPNDRGAGSPADRVRSVFSRLASASDRRLRIASARDHDMAERSRDNAWSAIKEHRPMPRRSWDEGLLSA